MTRKFLLLISLFLALVVGGGFGLRAFALGPGGPSEVLIPPQRIPLQFSHKQHLGFQLDCDFCHDKAASSVASSDNLLPTEEACASCHKIDRKQPDKEAKPAARCTACHQYEPNGSGGVSPEKGDQPLAVALPPPFLKFNHKIHVDRGVACTRCHTGIEQADLATRQNLPTMATCLGCHNQTATENRAPAACTTCHLASPVGDGTLQTRFPGGVLAPSGAIKGDAHTPDFAKHHAQVARGQQAYCENCHRQNFCLACHNGIVKPMQIHGNDYLSLHPVEARKNSPRCDSCHRRQTFCLGCHERSGVVDPATLDAPNSPANARPARRFHPPYDKWVLGPRTPEHHSWQAERDLRQCVACHREETCLKCHATAGVNVRGLPASRPFHVSPHPPGFARSSACRTLAAKNGRVCLKCHAPDDAHRDCL